MPSTSFPLKPKHVIFRSRGCKTCRARKIKCDETRPMCQRCIRSNFECQGYSEPTKFLSDNPRSMSTAVATTFRPAHRETQCESGTHVAKALPYDPELTHIAFLERRLDIGTPGDRKGFSWLRIGLQSSNSTSLIYNSSRCLADIYYGRVLHREDVATKAMIQYGGILETLRQQLNMPGSFEINSLMSVIMISVVIESVMNQSGAGFHAHLRGLAEIVRRAGPKAFMLRPNIILFEYYRCFIVGRAVVGSYSIFLADHEWKIKPWTYEPKTSFVKVWDIICDLPNIALNFKCLQDASQITSSPVSIGAMKHLKQDVVFMLQNLFGWRWEWEQYHNSDIGEFPTDVDKTSLIDEEGNVRYSTLIAFPNKWCALDVIYYNATLVYLSRICSLLGDHSLLKQTNRAPPIWMAQPLCKTPLKLPDDLISIEDASSEFYRSLDGYICAPREKAGDLYQLMFSSTLVSIRMDQTTLEAVWMKKLRTKIVNMSGLDLWAAARRSI